jgi:acetyltransferase-like isoleucine patch superfamily enzyme
VRLHDFATLTAGVSLAGSVQVGEAAYLGMNAAVRQGLTIGAGAVIGMGAAVLADVPAGETWVGVPARPLRVAHQEGRS